MTGYRITYKSVSGDWLIWGDYDSEYEARLECRRLRRRGVECQWFNNYM